MSGGWLFDGEHEINLKLERSQSFGLSKPEYGALAHAAMGALHAVGVKPAEIRLLADEPGASPQNLGVLTTGFT